jgi:hypothetical protein
MRISLPKTIRIPDLNFPLIRIKKTLAAVNIPEFFGKEKSKLMLENTQ